MEVSRRIETLSWTIFAAALLVSAMVLWRGANPGNWLGLSTGASADGSVLTREEAEDLARKFAQEQFDRINSSDDPSRNKAAPFASVGGKPLSGRDLDVAASEFWPAVGDGGERLIRSAAAESTVERSFKDGAMWLVVLRREGIVDDRGRAAVAIIDVVLRDSTGAAYSTGVTVKPVE